jgi:hypothetical protein
MPLNINVTRHNDTHAAFVIEDSDVMSIANHLRIAAQRYRDDARDMRAEPPQVRLAEQFDRQAIQADHFASIFEGED